MENKILDGVAEASELQEQVEKELEIKDPELDIAEAAIRENTR